LPKQPASTTRPRSVVPYVFLAIAIVSVLASAVLWKRQHDNHPKPGTRVIATTGAPSRTLAITAVKSPDIWHCSPGSTNTVLLSWSTTGAASVSIAVDGATNKPLFTDQGPASQVSVPAPCAPGHHTYYVIAKSADGKRQVTKSTTTRGV